MKRDKAIGMLLLFSISLAVLFALPTHAVTLTEIDPTSGAVGTEVRLVGTIDTLGGTYTIWFDINDDGDAFETGEMVASGNVASDSFVVDDTFVVPDSVGSDAGDTHLVALRNEAGTKPYQQATFAVITSRALSVDPEYAQEGDDIDITMEVTGGLNDTTYTYSVIVTDPNGTTHTSTTLSFDTDENGTGTDTDSYLTDWASAHTNFTGTYNLAVNETAPGTITNAASDSFVIGLTDALEYDRFDTVDVMTTGWTPNQNITVTITDPNDDPVSVPWDDEVDATDGTWTDTWDILLDAPLGTYNITALNATGDNKDVVSTHTFEVGSSILDVTVTVQPDVLYMRTETASVNFTIEYPNGDLYNATTFGSIDVSVYNDTTLVSTIALTSADYNVDTGEWMVEWKIPRDAILGTDYTFTLDVGSITDVNDNTGPTSDEDSDTFEVEAADLTVMVTMEPDENYTRTETAMAMINITYPDDSFYTADDLGTIQVRVYQGSTNVANVTLEADDYNSTTKQWTIGWVSPWNATLADDYVFTVKAGEVKDAANPNTGPTSDISTNTFELLKADLNVASINTNKSTYLQNQVVTVYFTATYQDGSPVTTGSAAITLTKPNASTTQLTATYVPANGRFEAKYTLTTGDPLGTWYALLEAQGLKEDADNMGPNVAKTTDFTVTQVAPLEGITAEVKISPRTLNLKSKGRWVTVHIELPEGYSAADIDFSTILLDDEVEPERTKGSGGGKLLVKFSRADVIAHIQHTYEITGSKFSQTPLTVTGEVAGTTFEGSDTIRVKH